MEIKRVIPSGYCKGVVHAIKLAEETRKNNPQDKIHVLGMIVHNSFVTDELARIGIITLDDSSKTKEELLDEISEGIVIFTAHGISDCIKQKALDKGLRIVDASCEDVLKTREIVKKHLAEGYDILYFGKRNHPEATAILSISPKIHLITSKEDIDALEITNSKLLLTNQTTMSYLELEEYFDYAITKYPHIKIIEEICNATSSRQKAISELDDCDLLYVVGDIKSNNTSKLKDIAISKGIPKVLMISSYQEINKKDLIGINKVYVTAGASTPPKLINEVMDHLNLLGTELS